MSACYVAAELLTWDNVEHVLAIAGAIVVPASALCGLMPRPAPGSRGERLRQLLEALALMFGHARARGALPASSLDKLSAQAADFLPTLQKGKP